MVRLASHAFAAFGILLVTCLAASAQVLPSFSTWENQRTSILNIGLVTGTQFNGFFTNRAPGFQCQNIPYPVENGTILPNGAITFTVNFAACSTVTTWKGRVIGSQMPTTWVLVHNGVRQKGSDLFKMRFPF
jgi:hypothetical protein